MYQSYEYITTYFLVIIEELEKESREVEINSSVLDPKNMFLAKSNEMIKEKEEINSKRKLLWDWGKNCEN